MSKNRDLDPLDPFPANQWDALNEFVGSASLNFVLRIKPGDATVLQVPAGAGNAQAAIAVEGRWRYVTASVERASPGGVARTLDVHVTAADNVFVPGSPGEVDNTVYAFDLVIVEQYVTPGTPGLKRKVAEAVWDGTKFTAVNPVVGGEIDTSTRPPSAHAASHRAGGSDELSHTVLAAKTVGSVGQVGQVRAGRPLAVTDFTTLLGLGTPVGLFPLTGTGNLGSGGNLSQKSVVVGFGEGIMGLAGNAEAAWFDGSNNRALYRADTGTSDPFRIKTGSWGCWFRTAKRGTVQDVIVKGNAGNLSFALTIGSDNTLYADRTINGVNGANTNAPDDVCDNRWHFGVATYDGTTLRVYVDGQPAGGSSTAITGPIFSGAAPLNIGSRAADAATAAQNPFFGRIDEAFVTADVLDETQIRLLYAAKVAHGYGLAPNDARLLVRRRRRGGALASTDFPTAPLRLYNFTSAAGSAAFPGTNIGSQGSTFNLSALLGSPAWSSIAGPDGTAYGAVNLPSGNRMTASDTGLPTTDARSMGCWFRTTASGSLQTIFEYGASGGFMGLLINNSGLLFASDNHGSGNSFGGPLVADGVWHHAVLVVEPGADEGLVGKLYVDGLVVATSTAFSNTILAGVNRFNIGGSGASAGTDTFSGDVDGAFVVAAGLTPEQISAIYNKGGPALPASPKNASDHIEAVDVTNMYVVFDTLEPQHQIDLLVTA